MEIFKLIVGGLSLIIMLTSFYFMFRVIKSKETVDKLKYLRITIGFCITVAFLDIITLDVIGASAWGFNTGLWIDSYFHNKRLG